MGACESHDTNGWVVKDHILPLRSPQRIILSLVSGASNVRRCVEEQPNREIPANILRHPPHGTWCASHIRGKLASTAPNTFSSSSSPNSVSKRFHFCIPNRTGPRSDPDIMIPFKSTRRVHVADPQPEFQPARYDAVDDNRDEEYDGGMRLRSSEGNVNEDQEPFMGVKVRRKTSLHREYQGDYIDIPSHPFLMKILQKQGYFNIFFFLSVFFSFFLFSVALGLV